jgi:ubiquinone/menaquinone biosynthesis C-methylase UbiE
MEKLKIVETYRSYVRSLGRGARRMEQAVGGDFETVGLLERDILILHGLQPDGYLIDVGCGSGRLANPLTSYLRGPYLGVDIVPELVDYARKLVGRPDWRFEVSNGLNIPERDEAADIVCFFSVFTHLLHEQSYAYLQEARRVLKPGGRVVFSFLEFAVPGHWPIFEAARADIGGSDPLIVFLGRDAIDAWASHLDLSIIAVNAPEEPNLPNLGQSVCVLEKPSEAARSSSA